MVSPDCPGDGLAWPGLDISDVRRRKPPESPPPSSSPPLAVKRPAAAESYSRLLRPVYSAVWSLALVVCRLVLSLSLAARQLWASLRRRRRGARSRAVGLLLEARKETGLRLPSHLAVVVQDVGSSNGDDHQLGSWASDLANLVVWCLVVGIPYVTLYDAAGKLLLSYERTWTIIGKMVDSLCPLHRLQIQMCLKKKVRVGVA
jgi:hypothetical protein